MAMGDAHYRFSGAPVIYSDMSTPITDGRPRKRRYGVVAMDMMDLFPTLPNPYDSYLYHQL